MKHCEGNSIRLYRSPSHLNHWIVCSDRGGWQIFPAKFHGWEERKPLPGANAAKFHQVPLWMAFNTGLLEAIVAKAA
jgi:hypothetical protein